MSILIRGMEMPKSCNECIMSIEQACMINGNIISDYWTRLDRPTDCPLVELPPHGRLIDADAFSKHLIETQKSEYNITHAPKSWSKAYECFDWDLEVNAPTILEAEEGE